MAKPERRHIPRPQIPEGTYVLQYVKHWVYAGQYGRKLVVVFRISEGEYERTEIARLFNVEAATGQRTFRALCSGALWAEFCAVMSHQLDTNKLRLDELPIGNMRGLPIRGSVRPVAKNQDGVPLLGGASYSVVRNLLGLVPLRVEHSRDTKATLREHTSIANPSLTPLLELGPTLDPIPTPMPTDDSASSDIPTATTFPMGKAKRALGESDDKADGCLRSSDASQIQRLMHSPDLSVDEIEWVREYDSYRGK